jgi:DNA (cytosine-5)-methyltransferase 1
MLATLSDLGYTVEWRVVNAADYGFPQRRRRVFILGKHEREPLHGSVDGFSMMFSRGALARALPCAPANGLGPRECDFVIEGKPHEVSASFGRGLATSPFENAGFMTGRKVWTQKAVAQHNGKSWHLGVSLVALSEVPEAFRIRDDLFGEPGVKAHTWRYLKGAKSEPRRHAGSDVEYRYSEGAMSFPDSLSEPARTILTGEGGSAPSRFKHVVQQEGVYRRLVPVELERLNGFPDGWTAGMPDTKRAFCMGNALVVGLVRRIGDTLAGDVRAAKGK